MLMDPKKIKKKHFFKDLKNKISTLQYVQDRQELGYFHAYPKYSVQFEGDSSIMLNCPLKYKQSWGSKTIIVDPIKWEQNLVYHIFSFVCILKRFRKANFEVKIVAAIALLIHYFNILHDTVEKQEFDCNVKIMGPLVIHFCFDFLLGLANYRIS